MVVFATRSGNAPDDEPIRVDLIDEEEVSEKQVMAPGNIAMLINETVGVTVQVTSPAIGASNIRMQGMNGKYASLLSDGLPLYGGQTSSLGLMQITPTDVRQVEVIKGAASALYGPAALGGVINLVSKRPGHELASDVLANASGRDGQDLTAYLSGPVSDALGSSTTLAYSHQALDDIDGDGWADVPGYERVSARPRLFWSGEGGEEGFFTIGGMSEQREGGTLPGRFAPDGRPFVVSQNTRRFDAGTVATFPVTEVGILHLRASGMTERRIQRLGDVSDTDRQTTLFAEASLSGAAEDTSWVGGVAFQRDAYRSEAFPVFDYTYDTPAVFGQLEYKPMDGLTLAASGRVDSHTKYGTHFSPRLSALYSVGDLSVRTSLGQGFYAPTPFVDEIQAAGLSRLAPLSGLRAEIADTASVDIGYRVGSLQANVTLFGSDVRDAVRLEDTGSELAGAARVRLVNVDGMTRTRGVEMTLRYRWDEVTVSGSYVHLDAREPDPEGQGRRRVPLTPQDTGGVDLMWERPGQSRLGFEAYYTGGQDLDGNPYRRRGKPYLELGLLGELTFGQVSVFLNAENLLNIRQTDDDPLLLPQRARDGRWTTDLWKPLDGLMVNAGIRFRFGGS